MKYDGQDVFGVHLTGDLHDDHVDNVVVSVQGIPATEENRGAIVQLLRHCAATVESGAPFQSLDYQLPLSS